MQIVIKASRQFGRSTYLANEILSYLREEENLNVLVVTPVKQMANNFMDLLSKIAKKEKDYVKESIVVSQDKIVLNENIIRVIPCYDLDRKLKSFSLYDIIAIDDADKCDSEIVGAIIESVKGNSNKLLLMSEEEK
jgi:hypothetical protein